MYKVRFFRLGTHGHFNRKMKGVFVKQFDTIDDVVREFSKKGFPKLGCCSLREDLGEEGFHIFSKKMKAKWRKDR